MKTMWRIPIMIKHIMKNINNFLKKIILEFKNNLKVHEYDF
jgi:hypothetical protein